MRSRLSPNERRSGWNQGLAAGPAAQLVVNTAGLMPFGAYHMKATGSRTRASSCFTTASPATRAMASRKAWICPSSVGAFSSGGDTLFQLDHRESSITPGLHQITGQLSEGPIGFVG